MYLVDLTEVTSNSATLSRLLDRTRGVWSALADEMDPTETLWVFTPNERRHGQFWPVAMSVADCAREESDLTLKNLITVHREGGRETDLRTVYEEILFFVKDSSAYRFDKDSIRVAHVYQGEEWGGEREKGQSAYHDTTVRRYNSDGKDPGNVWLSEFRNQTANETIDETRPMKRTEAAKRCLQAGSVEGETVHSVWVTDDLADVVEAEGRILNRRDEVSSKREFNE